MASGPVIRVLLRPRIGTPQRIHHPLRTSRRQTSTSSPSSSSSSPSPSTPPHSSSPKTTITNPKTTGPNNAFHSAAEAQPRAGNGQPVAAEAAVEVGVGGVGGGRAVFWKRLGPLTRAGEAYARAQRARPWATQVATSLLIYLCADLSAQRMNASSSNDPNATKPTSSSSYDPARTARSLLIGGAAAIPGYSWFALLERSFNFASSRALSVATKVLVNQLLFTPAFGAYFFGAQALLAGDSPREAWDRVCRAVPVSFAASCKVWPAVTAVSFAFVAPEYRPALAGVVAVAWQTYLSWLNRREEIEEEEAGRKGALVRTTPVGGMGVRGSALGQKMVA
ncbi:hypothetical protein F4810DRAFT_685735 [Camillea tinctor]|nr:hypothetical protein F4810DRAFT_685735 [Camillea tinctor]